VWVRVVNQTGVSISVITQELAPGRGQPPILVYMLGI
jgi:hypothetical protein